MLISPPLGQRQGVPALAPRSSNHLPSGTAGSSVALDSNVTVQSVPRMSSREQVVYLLLVGLTGIASLWYLTWWLNPEHLPMNWIFASEWQTIGASSLYFAALSAVVWSGPVQVFFVYWLLAKMRVPVWRAPLPGQRVAMVTCFVPGKEPYDLLERTLASMTRVRYPHDTWVLDEGNDPIVKEMCRKLGVKHFSRHGIPRYNQASGRFKAKTKAGNHNSWRDLYEHQYDFVAQMDMDYGPRPEFLERTLGYFDDPDVAFVGSPQIYNNIHRSWIARGSAEQAYVFYGPMQMGLYGRDVQLFIGANHVYRAEALRSIGGYQGHIVEDHLTGMKLYEQGWKSVYVPEVLCVGEGPEDWVSYFGQQMRWAFGLIDILFRHSPRILPRLKRDQRVVYFFLQQYYFFGVLQTVGALLTAFYLTLGWEATRMNFLGWMAHSLPPFVLHAILYRWVQRFYVDPKTESGWHWRGRALMIASWPIYAWASMSAIVGRRLAYAVTPKGKSAPRGYGPLVLGHFAPHLGVALVAAVGLTAGFLNGNLAPQIVGWGAFTIAGQFAMAMTALYDPRSPMPVAVRRGLVALPTSFVAATMVFAGVRFLPTDLGDYWSTTALAASVASPGRVVLPGEPGVPVLYGLYDDGQRAVPAQIDHVFFDWRKDPASFGRVIRNNANRGRTSLISWEPRFSDVQLEPSSIDIGMLSRIAKGEEDPYIRLVALGIKGASSPVLIRFAHEMDQDTDGLHPWAGQDPALYITAWRHVVDVFREEGATDVRWLWAPAGRVEADGRMPAPAYYPGDDYVDYTGFSVFIYWQWEEALGQPPHETRSSETVIGWGVRQLSRYGKPIVLSELGLDLHPSVAGERASWLGRAADEIVAGKYPGLAAVLYYNGRHNFTGGDADWRLEKAEERLFRQRLAPSK